MLYKPLLCGLLWLCTSIVSAKSLTGRRVLVVAEDAGIEGDYSQFLGDLEARDFVLDIKSPRAKDLALFVHGERSYDHAVFFPPTSKSYGNTLTAQNIAEFINQDGNVLLLTSPSGTTDAVRDLAAQLDIDLPPRDYVAVDHFNYDTNTSPEKHDVVLIPRPTEAKNSQNYFAGASGDVIAFRGAGHSIGNRPLLFPILSGSRTAYTYDAKEDEEGTAADAWAAGTQMQYITALQARNNARITISGSAEMLSNEFFEMTAKTPKGDEIAVSNRDFAIKLSQWTFKEIGVVKTVAVRHHLNESDAEMNPRMYRVKSHVNFEIELSEWSNDHWIPFTVPSTDALQLEFTMLDPYYRVPLLPSKTTEKSRVFSTSFLLPDQHGVFAFIVNYKRPFVSFIEEKYTVTVRHFAHDEFTRSWDISGAWVWIGGIAVTVAGWVVFCALWLWSKPTETSVKKTQ